MKITWKENSEQIIRNLKHKRHYIAKFYFPIGEKIQDWLYTQQNKRIPNVFTLWNFEHWRKKTKFVLWKPLVWSAPRWVTAHLRPFTLPRPRKQHLPTLIHTGLRVHTGPPANGNIVIRRARQSHLIEPRSHRGIREKTTVLSRPAVQGRRNLFSLTELRDPVRRGANTVGDCRITARTAISHLYTKKKNQFRKSFLKINFQKSISKINFKNHFFVFRTQKLAQFRCLKQWPKKMYW